MTLFPVIRDWIVEFLDENKDMTASMVGRNMLIEQVSSIMSFVALYSNSGIGRIFFLIHVVTTIG